MKQFLSPAAALNHSLFLGAVKDAREFHRNMLKYKRLGWGMAMASAKESRDIYLRRARRYLDRAMEEPLNEVMNTPPAFATDLAQAYRSTYPSNRYKKD